MPRVVKMQNETDESLLRRFRKQVAKAGTMSIVRRKRWHVGKSELRRIAKKKAARRVKRRLTAEVRPMSSNSPNG